MDLGPHAVFIVWAYVGAIVAVGGLVGYALFDSRRVASRLRDLEARGIRRRSAGNSP